MPIIQYGAIIKKYREELGITQEELSEGICSVPTLSRIENGERMPSKENITMLLQKLGKTDLFVETFVDKNDFYLHELKYRIRQAQFNGNQAEGRKLFEEYKHLRKDNSLSNRQFELLHEILFFPEKYTTEEKLEKLEHLIHQSCPSFSTKSVPKLLTYEEILILNNIARCRELLDDRESTVLIYEGILRHYDSCNVNSEEMLRTKPLILYNLANSLCAMDRFDECIRYCDEGILLARTTGRCSVLAYLLYVRGWALLLRKKGNDRAEAEKTFRQAATLADLLCVEFVRKNARETLKKELDTEFPLTEDLCLEWTVKDEK